MSDSRDGGPAFPAVDTIVPSATWPGATKLSQGPGMSLRDWFAGQAMVAYCAHASIPENIAEYCYVLADAMLAERAKELK